MNSPELTRLAEEIKLDSADQFNLRISFGIACIERVEHLLTDGSMIEMLAIGKMSVSGKCNEIELEEAAGKASEVARSHPGSSSLDGAGYAGFSCLTNTNIE